MSHTIQVLLQTKGTFFKACDFFEISINSDNFIPPKKPSSKSIKKITPVAMFLNSYIVKS